MELKGLKPSTNVIRLEIVKTQGELAEIFEDPQTELFRLERVRYADGQPVVVVTSYIPCSLAPGLMSDDLEHTSLYELLETKYGLEISHASRVLEAVNVSAEDIKLLGTEPKAAVHLIRTTAYLDNNEPFEYSIARYRGDNNSFTVNLKYRRA